MGSAACTVKNGGATAVASGNGQVVTPGATVIVALSDSTGVVGWTCRMIWTNGAVSEQTFSSSSMTLSQSAFTATFTAPAEGTAFICESELVTYTSQPTLRKTTFQLYCASASAPRPDFFADNASFIAGVQVEKNLPTQLETQVTLGHASRGVVVANIADLTAFTVASNDGLTYAAGERVLLANQTTASQNGIYVVGTVAGSTAPLTRAPDWASGVVLPAGVVILVDEGTLYAKSEWKVMTTGAITVATDSPAIYPRVLKGQATLASGTVTVSGPIYSATATSVQVRRLTAGGTVTSTVDYNPISISAGMAGSVVFNSQVAAGTIDTANNSVLTYHICNW